MKFYEAIMPTILLSTTTGTLPFHVIYENGEHKLKTTKTAKAVAVVYTIFFTIFLVDATLNPNNLIIFNYYQSIVSNLGLIMELIGGVVLVYIIYIFNLTFSDSICDMFVRCNEIDQSLKQFGNNLQYKFIYFYQVVHIVSGVGTFLVTSVVQYINSMAIGMGKLSLSLRIVLLGPLFIIFVMETQFICLALVLRFRFEVINSELSNLSNEQKKYVLKKTKVDVLPGFRGLANKPVEFASPSPLERLETLMILHDSLCDIVERINFNFGVQILISIGLKFIISIFCIFYCYWSKVVMDRTWSSILWFFWAVYNFYELIHLALSCQKAYAQMQITGTQVHKLLLHVTNPGLKEQLNIFSQQLLHRNVKFTALELFPIDATLVLSIIATGSTYLIIMLQFQDSTAGNKNISTILTLNTTHAIKVNM